MLVVKFMRYDLYTVMDLEGIIPDQEISFSTLQHELAKGTVILGCTKQEVKLISEVLATSLKFFKNVDCVEMYACRIKVYTDMSELFPDADIRELDGEKYTIIDLSDAENVVKLLNYIGLR